ncbi:MAG: MCP four helix bundle domain-containing protein, partial [Hylemonella sp.]|nr:MCP four helix bundle domain-containing protein [Hylemonella sp.]
MNNLKISTRLLVLVAVLSGLLILIGLTGLFGNSKSNEALRSVYQDRTVALVELEEVGQLVVRNRVLVMDMIMNPEPANIDRRDKELRANLEDVGKIWAAYMATELTPEEKTLADEFAALHKSLVQEGLLVARDSVRAGDPVEADRSYREKISPLGAKAREAMKKLVSLQASVAKAEYEAAVGRYQTILIVSIVAIAVGVIFAWVLGLALIRGISRSLRDAVQLSEAAARGDLTVQVNATGKDEVARVLQSLTAMQHNLAQIVSRVRQGSESVSTASAEIAQGNQDLSARTESQASSLEETAASMEELSSTVKQNADNARQANQLAQSAST